MKYQRATHVAWRRIDDEVILVDLAAKDMVGLNLSGGELWRLFEQPRDGQVLARAIAERSDGALLDEDVIAFIADLVDGRLLIVASGPVAVPRGGASEEPSGAADEDVEIPRLREPPRLLWREAVRQAAGTCAFLPGSGPLCNQAPFS